LKFIDKVLKVPLCFSAVELEGGDAVIHHEQVAPPETEPHPEDEESREPVLVPAAARQVS
jgi:hypothetical protein